MGQVQSFDKKHRRPMREEGNLRVQFLGNKNNKIGAVKTFPVSTIENLAFNLLSVQEMVQQLDFKLLLQKDGFSGFVKTDPEGKVLEMLPVHYDARRRVYTMRYVACDQLGMSGRR